LMQKPLATNMWTYEENFSTRTNGALHGQDSWVGQNVTSETGIVVQSTVAAPGTTKAVEVVSLFTHQSTRRTIPTPISSGSMFVDVRSSHTSGAGGGLILYDTSNFARMYITFDEAANIEIYDYDTTTYYSLGTYAADTWYRVNVQFNDTAQPDKYRARVKSWNGTVWSAWGSWSSWYKVNGGSYALMNAVDIGGEGSPGTASHKIWFGNISPRDQ
jgi:hypothetical protein